MQAYANHISTENPPFANDLKEWAKTESEKAKAEKYELRDWPTCPNCVSAPQLKRIFICPKCGYEEK